MLKGQPSLSSINRISGLLSDGCGISSSGIGLSLVLAAASTGSPLPFVMRSTHEVATAPWFESVTSQFRVIIFSGGRAGTFDV